jgi:uncharacterized protein YndB with AHSA1/START domain
MKAFRVERSLDIAAPAEKIYPLIADFRAWTQWSPYENRDPNLQRSYGGVASGVGATYGWEGNKNVGSGRMQILQAAPPSRLVIDLQFLKPFKAHNQAEFTLQPHGNTTRVTWAMTGPSNLMMRVMGLFMNMDKMIGRDFEAGLAKLKAVTENQ